MKKTTIDKIKILGYNLIMELNISLKYRKDLDEIIKIDNFQEVYMPMMRKSVDLGDSYGEISEFCHKYREPVFITQNGEKDLAVMSVEIYEEIAGKRKLYSLLEDGLNDIKRGDILSEEEMDKSLDLM